MKSTRLKRAIAALLAVAIGSAVGFAIGAPSADAQPRGSQRNKSDRQIVWYGVLEDGLAEAERTGKPIFLTSAAPQCVGVSGMW